jgi:hypothetical protein
MSCVSMLVRIRRLRDFCLAGGSDYKTWRLMTQLLVLENFGTFGRLKMFNWRGDGLCVEE